MRLAAFLLALAGVACAQDVGISIEFRVGWDGNCPPGFAAWTVQERQVHEQRLVQARDELVQVVTSRHLGEPLDDIEFVAAGVEMDFVVVHDDGDGSGTFVVVPVMAVVMALRVAVFTAALLKFQHNLFSCRMLRRLMSHCAFARTVEAGLFGPLQGILTDLNWNLGKTGVARRRRFFSTVANLPEVG